MPKYNYNNTSGSRNNGNLLKDTIKGIPAAAKRLGRDVSQVGVGTTIAGTVPALAKSQGPVIKGGLKDIGRALKGKSDENQYDYLGNAKDPQIQSRAPKSSGLVKNAMRGISNTARPGGGVAKAFVGNATGSDVRKLKGSWQQALDKKINK